MALPSHSGHLERVAGTLQTPAEAGSDLISCCNLSSSSAIASIPEITGIKSGEFRIHTICNLLNSEFDICGSDQACCVCAGLLVFLVACAYPLDFNAGRWSEGSFQQVLIGLDSILLLKWMQIRR